jgi:hypothetical protein
MTNGMNRVARWLPLVVLAVFTIATARCAHTEIQGVILNEDLNTPELMLPMARGINSEFGDIFLASNIQYNLESPTDGLTNDGTATGEIDATVGDFRSRPQSSLWAQAHEASWAAIFGDIRMKQVFTPQDYESSPIVARIWVYGGHAERILGESFCDMIYNYGIEGGILLGKLGPYDPSRLVPNDSAFKRAIAMFEKALDHAEAGVAAGVLAPEADPIFDPLHLVRASHSGLAQAYANLGNWTEAVAHARQVPDNYADWTLMHPQVDGGNDLADNFYGGDDLSIYRTPAALLWPTDPRVALAKCGDWAAANRDNDAAVPPASAFRNMATACGQLANEFRSESNRYPLWISRKYLDDNGDIELASGAEMRLIEAEAALRAGNLGEFTTQVNRARAARGVGPITQPTAAGALEYPNAQDDAWSILDRERYLELFLEARRFWDLRRWNHPFWTGNHVLLPKLVNEVPPGGRMKCYPVPNQECTTNASITCPVLT